MANWRYKIDLKDLWKQWDDGNGDLDITELAKLVAARIRTCFVYGNSDYTDFLEDIALDFEQIQDVEDFDDTLCRLYDWADTHVSGGFFDATKLCWVATTL